jgi:hypothetical protein
MENALHDDLNRTRCVEQIIDHAVYILLRAPPGKLPPGTTVYGTCDGAPHRVEGAPPCAVAEISFPGGKLAVKCAGVGTVYPLEHALLSRELAPMASPPPTPTARPRPLMRALPPWPRRRRRLTKARPVLRRWPRPAPCA